MSSFQYGGQAVIEGVMMRGPDSRAVAVRKPDQSIVVDEKNIGSITRRVRFVKWPVIRGVVMLIESLVMGIEALTYSAGQATGEEEELTPGLWLQKLTTSQPDDGQVEVAIAAFGAVRREAINNVE